LPHLLARKGSVVPISSVAGRVERAGGGGYCATRFGIGAFCESLRKSHHAGKCGWCDRAGGVDTELREHITTAAAAARAQRVQDNRNLQSDDIAAAVLLRP